MTASSDLYFNAVFHDEETISDYQMFRDNWKNSDGEL